MTPIRILIVTDQYAPMVGGVPALTESLAAGLADRGHAVTVLAPSQGSRSATGHCGQARVAMPGSIPWPWYPGMRVARVPVRSVRSIIARADPDVVHIHSPVVLGVLSRRRAMRAGVPVLYTNHFLPSNVRARPGDGSRPLRTSFYAWVVGFANRCDFVTAPTATGLDLLQAHGLRTASQVVSNGVDLARFTPGPADDVLRRRYLLPAGQPVILSVGRLSGEKRLDVLLAAARRLTRPATLVIAGTGPQESLLRRRAALHGQAGKVVLTGHVPDADLPGLYRLADVFAIASEAELQSMAAMEAMATGLPVVAADACALPELVRHDRNGFLFPPGRADRLAGYLDLLVTDPRLRGRMSAESLRTAGSHDRSGTLARWEALYRMLSGSAESTGG